MILILSGQKWCHYDDDTFRYTCSVSGQTDFRKYICTYILEHVSYMFDHKVLIFILIFVSFTFRSVKGSKDRKHLGIILRKKQENFG